MRGFHEYLLCAIAYTRISAHVSLLMRAHIHYPLSDRRCDKLGKEARGRLVQGNTAQVGLGTGARRRCRGVGSD